MQRWSRPMQAPSMADAAVLPTSAGLAALSAALATGCSVADEVCRSAADNACGAWVARSNPGSARSSICLVPEERERRSGKTVSLSKHQHKRGTDLRRPDTGCELSCVSHGERTCEAVNASAADYCEASSSQGRSSGRYAVHNSIFDNRLAVGSQRGTTQPKGVFWPTTQHWDDCLIGKRNAV